MKALLEWGRAILASSRFWPIKNWHGGVAVVLILITLPLVNYLALALVFPLAWYIHRRLPALARFPEAVMGRLMGFSDKKFIFLIIIIFILQVVALKMFLFHWSPKVQDNIAQMFQAKIFMTGHIRAPAPPLPEFFTINDAFCYIIFDGPWCYSYYFWLPCLLWVPFMILGAEHLLVPLLGAANLWLAHAIGKRYFAPIKVRLALLLTIMSPFYLLISGSFYNNQLSLFLFMVSLYFADTRHPTSGKAFLSGSALGLMANNRPVPALFALLTHGALFLLGPGRFRLRERWPVWMAFLLGVGLFGSTLFLHNHLTTGNPFLPPIKKSLDPDIPRWYHGELVFREFVDSIRAHLPTFYQDPFKGVDFKLGTLVSKLNNFYLSWNFLGFHLNGLPGLSLILLLLFIHRLSPREKILLHCALLLGYLHIFAYPFTCRTFGPRYFFEAILLFQLLVASALIRLDGITRFRPHLRALAMAMGVHLFCFYWPWTIRVLKLQAFMRVDWNLADRLALPPEEKSLVFCDVGLHWDVYLSLFARLDPAFSGAKIFARDLGEKNSELARLYPDHRRYHLAVGEGEKGPYRFRLSTFEGQPLREWE